MSLNLLSRVRLFETPWTLAYQAPQSMEFSRQEYWSGLPFPSPGYSEAGSHKVAIWDLNPGLPLLDPVLLFSKS